MMHEPEKSDSAVVAMKSTNNAEQSAAELVERRAGTKGNVGQQSTRRAQDRESVTGAGTRTTSRKAKEEGAVHVASAPCRPRHAENGVLRAEA